MFRADRYLSDTSALRASTYRALTFDTPPFDALAFGTPPFGTLAAGEGQR